jgi:hypothetical protein
MPNNNASFAEKANAFAQTHRDYNAVLNAGHEKGLRISPEAIAEIVKLGVPEVGYWLTSPKNADMALRFHSMTPEQQVAEVSRIAKELQRTGEMNDLSTDDYLRKRRQDIRSGERRR